MGTYTDSWLQRQWSPEVERFTVHTPPDPGHGDKSEASNVTTQMDAPLSQPQSEIVGDVIWENVDRLPLSDAIDNTDTGPGGTKFTGVSGKHGSPTSPLASLAETAAARGNDKGAGIRSTTDTLPLLGHGWMDHEQPYTALSEGARTTPMASQSGDAYLQLRRGINSDPVNDGDSGRADAWAVDMPSWKTGRYQRTNIQRDFRFPTLSHGEVKYTQERTVTIIGDAPPPVKSTKYDSPFSSLQKFLPKRIPLTGGIRREPAPWYEQAIVANDIPQNPSNYSGVFVVP